MGSGSWHKICCFESWSEIFESQHDVVPTKFKKSLGKPCRYHSIRKIVISVLLILTHFYPCVSILNDKHRNLKMTLFWFLLVSSTPCWLDAQFLSEATKIFDVDNELELKFKAKRSLVSALSHVLSQYVEPESFICSPIWQKNVVLGFPSTYYAHTWYQPIP